MKRLSPLLLIGLVGCSGGGTLSLTLSNTTVELDAYSGLPNPRWQLNPNEVNELEDRVNGLPESAAVEIPSQLGYRGFNIIDGNNLRLTVSSNGYVVVHEDDGDKFYRDTKDVQGWLKRQAEARGFGNLLMRQ
jgi:hypothetical protein